MFNIPSILLLVAILFISDTYDRAIQKIIRLLSKIIILKSFIGSVLGLYMMSKHLDNKESWKEVDGISTMVITLLELLGFIVGVYIAKQTKKIIQIVDLEFSEKHWTNYVEITERF